MKSFKELRIWQKGTDVAVNCYKLTETFSKEEKFEISMQITKAGVSIPSNIAEIAVGVAKRIIHGLLKFR